MEYKRVEKRNAYSNITIVDDKGNYTTFSLWADGTITSFYKTTLQKMGWSSTKEFLKERNKFKAVAL